MVHFAVAADVSMDDGHAPVEPLNSRGTAWAILEPCFRAFREQSGRQQIDRRVNKIPQAGAEARQAARWHDEFMRGRHGRQSSGTGQNQSSAGAVIILCNNRQRHESWEITGYIPRRRHRRHSR